MAWSCFSLFLTLLGGIWKYSDFEEWRFDTVCDSPGKYLCGYQIKILSLNYLKINFAVVGYKCQGVLSVIWLSADKKQ